MTEEQLLNNTNYIDENGNPVETQYVDEFGNPIDPSLIDANGNYIGEQVTQYVDEFGNPIDPSLIDANGNYIGDNVEAVTNSGVQSTVIDQSEIASALNSVSDTGAELVTSVTSNPITSASAHQMDNKELLKGMVTFDYNNVPITDIVNSIILDSINKGASDIHLDPFEEGIKIRIRIDGELNDYSIVPLFVKKNMITRVKIISGMNITESRVPQDGAIRTELANKTIDLRVSCLPTNMGEKIVIRILDYSMSASGVEALDFNEKNLDKVNKMLSLPNGIILVTGATGSGKSTTVYSMLQKLNVEGTNLVTVEDPIEMNIGGINQVQAVSEIGLDFATVLRSILRQDPDVIMIGEIRDDETARIAVRASITGHLVLSTIHTNNSLNTIERLTDMSVERYLLGSALSGIISQKLARRLCDHCKKLRPTTEYEKEVFKKTLDLDVNEIYEPVGCPECSKGYRGRIAVQEVLLVNQQLQDAIIKGVPKAVLRQLVYGENGTQTMLEDGLEKVISGKTSFEEILKLIDLDDDLGSGTQLGLADQLDAAQMNNFVGAPQTINSNQPININITPEMLQGLQLPIQPVYMDSDDDEDEEVVIKPIKHKKKKKKIVEIDPETLKEMMDDDDDEIETLDEIEETPVVVPETVEPVEILEEVEEDKPLETEEIELIDLNSMDTEPTLEKPADQEAENELLLNKDKLENLLIELYDTKKIVGKKKFNIKVKTILAKISPIYKKIKEIDDEYRFDDKTEHDIKEYLRGIAFTMNGLMRDEEKLLYKNTIKDVQFVLGLIDKDFDIETMYLDKPSEALEQLRNEETVETLDDVLEENEIVTPEETVEVLDDTEDINLDDILDLDETDDIISLDEEESEESFDDLINDIETLNDAEIEVNLNNIEDLPTISFESDDEFDINFDELDDNLELDLTDNDQNEVEINLEEIDNIPFDLKIEEEPKEEEDFNLDELIDVDDDFGEIDESIIDSILNSMDSLEEDN